MKEKKKTDKKVKLWIAAIITSVCIIIGTGFYLDLSANSEASYESLKLFTDVIELVEKNYVDEVETKDLIEKAIQGMVNGLDPHSSLLPPDAFKELQVDTQGEFTGIGISITMRNGLVTVISPIEGTPAYKAGILAGDKIIKVDGEVTKDLREAVKNIRGPKGTKVVVTIVREGTPEPIEFTIVRDVIPIESVKSVLLKPGYGYVWVTNFRENSTRDLELALKKLETGETPIKGLILDLRDNPGGLLNQAIKISDIFLEKGVILSIKGRLERNTKVFQAQPNTAKRDYPIVVLINGGSASASEIVAGALQDQKRALILGTTSFGKGSVQNVEVLRDGYGLKLTIARYYTPNGTSIQAKGITPDIEVKRKSIEKEDENTNKTLQIKEKDLKNHLEAEPTGKDKNKDNPVKETKEKEKTDDSVFRHGLLTLERLQTDNQVNRALEILISYDVFKDIKG